MTVDEILASGQYTDRRGRRWEMCRIGDCPWVGDWWGYSGPVETMRHVSFDQMRLLIERDRHRDECPGLADCMTHPVLAVIVCYEHGEGWGLFKVGVRAQSLPTIRRTLPEAMDAARALAVDE